MACVLGITPPATPQTFTAQISGHVSDESGAVLPGVVVTATNDEDRYAAHGHKR